MTELVLLHSDGSYTQAHCGRRGRRFYALQVVSHGKGVQAGSVLPWRWLTARDAGASRGGSDVWRWVPKWLAHLTQS